MKIAHIIRVTHRDEVEAHLTDWLREAYDFEPLAKSAKTMKKTPVKDMKRVKKKPRKS